MCKGKEKENINAGAGRKHAPELRSATDRRAGGKALRERTPRSSHGQWAPDERRDPLKLLEKSNQGRLPELVPIRYGRMMRSPFAFLRGSAALMAYDLAHTQSCGVHLQACGDCHLSNFGIFATPERDLVFDINDFDETLPAPWEWDLKRLVASFAVAARENGITDADVRELVLECARSYREHIAEYSYESPLDIWYKRMDSEALLAAAPTTETRKNREALFNKARKSTAENVFLKIAEQSFGHHRFIDQPPLLFHVHDIDAESLINQALAEYRASMPEERRTLFDRYRFEDCAVKVVGVGSVGTRCLVGLFFDEDNHPLILQFKEARRSVLEPYVGKSGYEHQGQRVVVGQRLMQSTSDIFLGWFCGRKGRAFYVRQLRDMKLSISLESVTMTQWKQYAFVCGWALARAHAKSGDVKTICGYLGESDSFDRALCSFSLLYADQTEKDHALLVKEVRAGHIKTLDK